MRFAAAGLALWASVAVAIPSDKGYHYRSAEEMKDELLPLSEMSFTGPVTIGGPNVTLHGDASSIYDQILALNPEFDASAFGGAASVERGLEARQSTGNWNCNNGVTVERYYSQCANAINRLFTLGTSYCSVAPSTCARVSCSNSCSIYLCNNQFSQVNVYCQDIAIDMGIIVSKCGSDNGNGDTRARGSLHFTGHYTSLTQQAC
ncbi:hypothetical protein QIS74_01628 [Colletotrichum tabaci]|uniref:Secreted protein n=1 Tax=Colletotrichum tabaci TaxID=1209068 RepID=A0AAV9TPW7_9PEZI